MTLLNHINFNKFYFLLYATKKLNKKINKISKKIVDKIKLGVILFNQDKGNKNKGEIKMMALNLSEL